jgi:hypothetical protein
MNKLEQFQNDGFLIIENFNSAEECDDLMQRAFELTANFDYKGHPSVFQTSEQTRTSDDYFLNSGGNISFFFEKMRLMKKASCNRTFIIRSIKSDTRCTTLIRFLTNFHAHRR